MPAPYLLATLGALLSAALPHPRLPIVPTELLYARVAVKLTLANGGDGRYGRVWGIWRRARLTPGLGFFQPDFQCAEYVMRCLKAGGLPVATPPPSSPAWPNLVNVDRILMLLDSRGLAEPLPVGRLRTGDALFFRFLQQGPDRFSHTALVIGTKPMSTSAHDRNRWAAPLSAYPPYQELLGLHVEPVPTPPDGLSPLGTARWAEVALRDPPVRSAPGNGSMRTRLYLGHLVYLTGIDRASGSRTGWLHVFSGPLTGFMNGDFLTRVEAPVRELYAGDTLYGHGTPTRTPVPVAVRGAWGRRLYVDAFGCPVPIWTGNRCLPAFGVLARDTYPVWQVTASRPVLLTRSPVPGSVSIVGMSSGETAAAERIGPYAAIFSLGGPGQAWGVLYAPAQDFVWRAGSVALFAHAVTLQGMTVPAETAASIASGELVTPFQAWPLPATPPPGLLELPPCHTVTGPASRAAPAARGRSAGTPVAVPSSPQALCALSRLPPEAPLAAMPKVIHRPARRMVFGAAVGRTRTGSVPLRRPVTPRHRSRGVR